MPFIKSSFNLAIKTKERCKNTASVVAGQIHGTWGGCALIPQIDPFVILNHDL
jgi:hypothetical protein